MQQEPGVWVEGPDGELIPDYESTFPEISEGQVVHGTVVRVDKDEVLVDIGYKSEGVIPIAELSIRRSINPADEVSIGDEIDALRPTWQFRPRMDPRSVAPGPIQPFGQMMAPSITAPSSTCVWRPMTE